jgi:hypothetical protein
MDKDVQLELVKALVGLPTSAMLAFFLITIYRDFRSLVAALLVFMSSEITAWLSVFRETYTTDTAKKPDNTKQGD